MKMSPFKFKLSVNETAQYCAVFFMAIIFGVIAAYGNVLVTVVVGVTIFGVGLLLTPSVLFFATLFTSLVFSGVFEIFFSFSKANWCASALALLLWLSVFFSESKTKNWVALNRTISISRALLVFGITLYFCIMVFSSLVNLTPIMQMITGVRNYIPYLGVFLFLALDRLSTDDVKKGFIFILYIAAIQGVVCLAEQFIIVPKRADTLAAVGGAAEAIVGSFGGNPLGGGYTGEMAVFVTVSLFLCYIFWQIAIVPRWLLVACILSWCISVGLAETKIVILLLPILLAAMLWRYPGKIDKRIINLIVLVAASLSLVLFVYAIRFWSDDSEVVHAFLYSFDPKFQIDPTHRGRIASIIHWWDNAFLNGPLIQALVGYGPSASLESSAISGEGTAVTLYGFGLDNNAITKLLWDFGLLGTISFILICIAAFFEAVSLSFKHACEDWIRWSMVGMKVWILAFMAMLPYQVAMLGGAAMQFLFWFSIGWIYVVGSGRYHSAAKAIQFGVYGNEK